MSYLIIFLLTVIMSCQGDLMYENITGVSLKEGMHIWIILYAIVTATFYAYQTYKLYKQLSKPRVWAHIWIVLTAITMIAGSFFPYTINSKDIFSTLHVYCSMSSCLSFLILLFLYNRFLSYENFIVYSKIHWYYDLGLQFLGILVIVFTRVNGYLEILFAVLVTGYLYMLDKELKKSIQ